MSTNYLYRSMPHWRVSIARWRRKRPCGNRCTLLGIQQVAQLTLQWMNALWMHNGLPASAITEVVLMQSYSSPLATERYSEAPAWDQCPCGPHLLLLWHGWVTSEVMFFWAHTLRCRQTLDWSPAYISAVLLFALQETNKKLYKHILLWSAVLLKWHLQLIPYRCMDVIDEWVLVYKHAYSDAYYTKTVWYSMHQNKKSNKLHTKCLHEFFMLQFFIPLADVNLSYFATFARQKYMSSFSEAELARNAHLS